MTQQEEINVHKDFHGALSRGIEYLHEHYGADAVREYEVDWRTAAYIVALQHLETVYMERGIFP